MLVSELFLASLLLLALLLLLAVGGVSVIAVFPAVDGVFCGYLYIIIHTENSYMYLS